MKSRLIVLSIIVLFLPKAGNSERIKDIVDIQGIRSNSLTGYGLVVGLDGTGDESLPSQKMMVYI